MKLLLLGADGQVGFELLRALAPLGEVVATTRRGELPGKVPCARVDLGDFEGLAALIRAERPHCIVNAAAYTAVDRAEDETELATRVNGKALGVIGACARELNARVVHYSTDYVFAGDGTRPYTEEDAVSPLNAYGHGKLIGEVALRDSGCAHLIFRTAWVYGARGHNFLRTMLRLGAERDVLSVVADQRGAPTTARGIAEVTAQALNYPELDDGVYHLAAAGETTWHGFARAIFETALRGELIANAPEVRAIASKDFPTRARRPAYSVLDSGLLRERAGLGLPDWRRGLDAVIGELASLR